MSSSCCPVHLLFLFPLLIPSSRKPSLTLHTGKKHLLRRLFLPAWNCLDTLGKELIDHENYDQPRQHIQKQRHYFASKRPSSQGYGFSSSHVWMWELGCEESWALKNWCLWTVMLEKSLESPSDCKEIKPVNPKGNQSWIFIGRIDTEVETQSIESVMSSSHLILCHPLLLPPSIFPTIRVFSNKSVLHIRWPKYWSFRFSISPSKWISKVDFL